MRTGEEFDIGLLKATVEMATLQIGQTDGRFTLCCPVVRDGVVAMVAYADRSETENVFSAEECTRLTNFAAAQAATRLPCPSKPQSPVAPAQLISAPTPLPSVPQVKETTAKEVARKDSPAKVAAIAFCLYVIVFGSYYYWYLTSKDERARLSPNTYPGYDQADHSNDCPRCGAKLANKDDNHDCEVMQKMKREEGAGLMESMVVKSVKG